MTLKNKKIETKITIIAFATLLLATGFTSNIPTATAIEGDVLATLFCAGPGVGVGFDGTTLYWIGFDGINLHRCTTTGVVLADVPITGLLQPISTISWDASRGIFWGASPDTGSGVRQIYQITTAGVATPMFTVVADGFFYTDGLAYDGMDDSLWISGDVSPNIWHYTIAGALIAGPTPIPTTSGCGNSGIAAGTGVLYLGWNGCNIIQKHDKATLALQLTFPIGTGRTEDLECDNVTFTPLDAVWTKDAFDNELIAFEVPAGTCPVGGGGDEQPTTERMTGGGSVIDPIGTPSTRVTHGFELHCDVANVPNNLEVNWGKGNNFHLTSLTSTFCTNDSAIIPNPPAADFDTYNGTGTGKLNGVSGATIEFTFTDAGEPGKNDHATIVIKDSSSSIVLSVSGNLKNGNQQAHK